MSLRVVVVLAIPNTIIVSVEAIVRVEGKLLLSEATIAMSRQDGRACVLIRVPEAISKVVCVAAHPSVHSLCSRLFLLLVPVRFLLVVSVEGDSGRVRHLLSLGVVLDDFPVLKHRDIDISKLDLSLLLLFDLRQFLPFK